MHRFVITKFDGWPIVINIAAEKTSSEFKRTGEAKSFGCVVRIVDGAVCVARHDSARTIDRKSSAVVNEVLILRGNGLEVFLSGGIDAGRLRIFDHVTNAQPPKYPHRIT